MEWGKTIAQLANPLPNEQAPSGRLSPLANLLDAFIGRENYVSVPGGSLGIFVELVELRFVGCVCDLSRVGLNSNWVHLGWAELF